MIAPPHQPSVPAGPAPPTPDAPFRFDGRTGPVDMLILAALGDRWLHGYALIGELMSRSDGQLDLPQGTVYPALHRLSMSGHLHRRTEVVDGRRRQYYRCSPRGREHLQRRHRQWRAMTAIVDGLLDRVGEPGLDIRPAR